MSDLWTRRQYLTMHALMKGASPMLAAEAVASVALEHDWDLNEQRTWDEWEDDDE